MGGTVVTIDPLGAVVAVGAGAGSILAVWKLISRSRDAFRSSIADVVSTAIAEVHARIDDHMDVEEEQLREHAATAERMTEELTAIRSALIELLEKDGRRVVVLPPTTEAHR